jgi:hypothetical protein
MNRLAAVSAVVAFAIAFAWFQTSGASSAGKGPLVLHLGDTVRIAGTNVGCAVAKRQGATTVECLPAARKRGSYATLIGDHSVLVVRFKSPGVAQTVFHARQYRADPMICQ